MILAIYCSGDAGRDILNLVQKENKWEKIIFIDDVVDSREVCGVDVYRFAELESLRGNVEIAIGNGEPTNRKKLFEKIKDAGYPIATIVAKSANIQSGAQIGEGCILYDCVVATDAMIHANTVVGGGSAVGHGDVIGENCVIGARVFIAGNCQIGDLVYIAPGALLKDRIRVGDFAIISMGAVVLRNVKEKSIMIGNPAKRIGMNEIGKVFNMFELE